MVRLSPDEGDALIPLIDEAFAMVARAFDKGGRTTSSPPLGAFPLPGQADPAGVLARVEASAPPEISFLMSRVIGSLLDRIARTVLGSNDQNLWMGFGEVGVVGRTFPR